MRVFAGVEGKGLGTEESIVGRAALGVYGCQDAQQPGAAGWPVILDVQHPDKIATWQQ